MPVSRALRNLLKLRNLEAEQHKAALTSALNELHALERALDTARERRIDARRSAFDHAANDGVDRLGYQLQQTVAARCEALLQVQQIEVRERAEDARALFVSKRVEQRQAETLVHAAQQHEEIEQDKRLQRGLDDLNLRPGRMRPKTR